jgi:hypothetical protein
MCASLPNWMIRWPLIAEAISGIEVCTSDLSRIVLFQSRTTNAALLAFTLVISRIQEPGVRIMAVWDTSRLLILNLIRYRVIARGGSLHLLKDEIIPVAKMKMYVLAPLRGPWPCRMYSPIIQKQLLSTPGGLKMTSNIEGLFCRLDVYDGWTACSGKGHDVAPHRLNTNSPLQLFWLRWMNWCKKVSRSGFRASTTHSLS